MLRACLAAVLVCLTQFAAAAEGSEVEALIVPGACFVGSDKGQSIDRIELQFMQVISKDRSPIGGLRIQLGIQPRHGEDTIPSGLSAPCSGAGPKYSCTLECNDGDKRARFGRFSIRRLRGDRLQLVIDTPLLLNACQTEGKEFAVSGSRVGKAFLLRLAESNNCFH